MTKEESGTMHGTSLRYSWFAVIILMLANISSFIDRQILALLVGPIKRDLRLSDTGVSLLMGLSFALFYTVFGILIAWKADRSNRRNIIMAGIGIWSLMTALCAGVKNFGQFFLARMGVGVGEATLSPSAYSMITDLFPKRKLGLAMSVFTMGIFLGSGLALAIGAGLVASLPQQGMIQIPVFGPIFHWQKLFLIIGLPGLIIAALIWTIREPERTDLHGERGVKEKLTLKESFQIILRYPKTYFGICIGTAFTAFINYGCSAWIPTYLNRSFGWPVPKAGLTYGLVLCLGAMTGILWGGWYADKLRNRGKVNGRLWIGVISGVMGIASLFIPLLPNPTVVVSLLFIPSFFLAAPMGAATTALQELMPNRVRALSSAIFLFLINIIGLGLGPTGVALITDYIFHNESKLNFSLSLLFLVGGLFTLYFYQLAYRNYPGIVLQNQTALKPT